MNDPDGPGFDCAAFDDGATASCVDTAVNRVVVDGGDGRDTLEDKRPLTVDQQALNGGAGDDTLIAPLGGADRLELNGGPGDDVLTRNRLATSLLALSGGPGDDRLQAGVGGQLGQSDHGDDGNDTFVGAADGIDVFAAEPGADTYVGGTLAPGPGDDPVTHQLDVAADEVSYDSSTAPVTVTLDGVANDGAAGEGDNVLPDIEIVGGGAGADRITAGAHPVHLYGRPGDDRLTGSGGDDSLYGDAGSDVLLGGGGDDWLDDGDFTPDIQDAMQGPAGNDRLDGGPGNDGLTSNRGADALIGGTGFDSAEFFRVIPRPVGAPPPSRPAPFALSLDDVANDGQRATGEGDNVHSDIEELFIGDGDDLVVGSRGPDAIYANAGNDRIVPGAAADSVFAGRGDDAVSAVDRTTDRIDCEQGNDRVDVDLPGDQPERADISFDCETITGVAFGPLAQAADRTAPRISGLRMSHRRFAVGRRNTPRSAARTRRGTAFIFRLSENARVTITIKRKLGGRGKRTRLVKAATLVRPHPEAGPNRIPYTGRVRGRALRPGRYRATVRAVDRAGNRSKPKRTAFTIARR